MRNIFIFSGILSAALVLSGTSAAYAFTGAIDSTNAYAWGENVGWVNFGSAQGSVQVPMASSSLTGYAWGENVGWISLNCTNTSSCDSVNYAVTNDGSGNLSGYAWGENVGWISFNCANTSSCNSVNYSVIVDQGTGDFSGYAWGENVGWISFNCANTSSCGTVSYKVQLASAAATSTTPIATSTGGGSSSASFSSPATAPPSVPSSVPVPPSVTPPVSPAHIRMRHPAVPPSGKIPSMPPIGVRSNENKAINIIERASGDLDKAFHVTIITAERVSRIIPDAERSFLNLIFKLFNFGRKNRQSLKN